MRGKLLFAVVAGLTIHFFAYDAHSLRCESLEPLRTSADSPQVDFKGPAETLFVVGSDQGMYSEWFRKDLDRYYKQNPGIDRRVLSDELIYAYCTVLVTATEVTPPEKVALLNQFIEKVQDLDREEDAKKATPLDFVPGDPRRVEGDWNCFSNGHAETTFLRIRLGPEGRLEIDQIDAHGDPSTPRFAGSISEVRLEGSMLRYNIHFPTGRTSRVHLSIIDRDQLFGTYTPSDLATGFDYELRMRGGPGDKAIATEPSAFNSASSTASNSR